MQVQYEITRIKTPRICYEKAAHRLEDYYE